MKNVSLKSESYQLEIPSFIQSGISTIPNTKDILKLKKAMVKRRKINKAVAKITSFAKEIFKVSTLCSVLFIFGQIEHPDTSFISRFSTCIVQGILCYTVYSLIKDNWRDFIFEIRETLNNYVDDDYEN